MACPTESEVLELKIGSTAEFAVEYTDDSGNPVDLTDYRIDVSFINPNTRVLLKACSTETGEITLVPDPTIEDPIGPFPVPDPTPIYETTTSTEDASEGLSGASEETITATTSSTSPDSISASYIEAIYNETSTTTSSGGGSFGSVESPLVTENMEVEETVEAVPERIFWPCPETGELLPVTPDEEDEDEEFVANTYIISAGDTSTWPILDIPVDILYTYEEKKAYSTTFILRMTLGNTR